jgi:polyribonucleotide 5'-hydroxyl-kinase
MAKNYDNKPPSSASAAASDERISVVKLSKSGGCVDRDAAFMKSLRESQIRTYFFGISIPSTASSALSLSASSSATKITLSPHAQQLDFDSFAVYNYAVVTADEEEDEYDPSQFGASDSLLPGDTDPIPGQQEDTSSAGAGLASNSQLSLTPSSSEVPLKRVTSPPQPALSNTLLAITHVPPNTSPPDIRDASVMGFLYVADVDADRSKIRVLAPIGGRTPARALVWGRKWPGEVIGLVG